MLASYLVYHIITYHALYVNTHLLVYIHTNTPNTYDLWLRLQDDNFAEVVVAQITPRSAGAMAYMLVVQICRDDEERMPENGGLINERHNRMCYD